MITKNNEFYEQFKCLGGDCPYSCCKGWRVQVDAKTYENYLKEPGLKGLLLTAMTTKHPVYGHLMRKLGGKCPFQNREHLCSHQCQGRMDLMPDICILYPRLSVSYGDYQEVTLELSCIRVAELFLENLGRLEYTESTEEIPVFWIEENDDQNFLKFLLEDREQILDYLWNEETTFSYENLTNKMNCIYKYVYEEYMHILSDELEEAKNLNILDTDITYSEHAKAQKTFYKISMLNEILYEWFDNSVRTFENMRFHQLFSEYKKQFSKLYENEADAYFEKQMKKLLKKHPEYGKLFYSYYSYLLQESYLRGYGDYYIIKSVLLSNLFTQYMMIFFLVNENSSKTNFNLALLIMTVEKALRHNESLEELMLKKIREKFIRENS